MNEIKKSIKYYVEYNWKSILNVHRLKLEIHVRHTKLFLVLYLPYVSIWPSSFCLSTDIHIPEIYSCRSTNRCSINFICAYALTFTNTCSRFRLTSFLCINARFKPQLMLHLWTTLSHSTIYFSLNSLSSAQTNTVCLLCANTWDNISRLTDKYCEWAGFYSYSGLRSGFSYGYSVKSNTSNNRKEKKNIKIKQ